VKKVLVLIAAGVFVLGQTAFAEISNDDLLNEIRNLRQEMKKQEQRISELEEQLAGMPKTVELSDMTIEDFDKHLDTHLLHRIGDYQLLGGLKMGAGSTFIIQGTDNANGSSLSDKGEDVTDASYSMYLTFEKEFEDYGKVFMGMETGDGAGVEDELQLFSNVNRDADDSDNSLCVAEAWHEHYFSAVPAALRAGKIDPTALIDNNDYANDECSQFLGRMFRNSPVIEFPDNSAGLRLNIEPVDIMGVSLLVMDGDGDWEDVADEIFFAGQLNFKPGLFDRNGNYRLIGWLNDRDHTKWNDSSKNQEKAYGIGISLDQELTDNLGMFARYGWQDPDVYLNGEEFSLEQAWSTGLRIAGSAWGREDDIVGIAVGQIMPSGEYKKSDSSRSAKDEGHFEAYYNYKVNDHLVLAPDLQVIWNPYGDDASNGNNTITVMGLRGQLDF